MDGARMRTTMRHGDRDMAAATSHCGNRWLRGSMVAPGPLFVAIGADENRKRAPITATRHLTRAPRLSQTRIIVASVVGTAIEFYGFYIYGTAAALVLGQMFFP